MLKVRQGGDDRLAKPGTSNQTGNSAPKYPWSSSPIGKTARVACLLSAYSLGWADEHMASAHAFPTQKELATVFNRLFPEFGPHFNEVRRRKAEASDYDGALKDFSSSHPHNRLRYCFAKPGSKKAGSERDRSYGFSDEHPKSTAQRGPSGLGEVWERCSVEIERRIQTGETITLAEAEAWGSAVQEPGTLDMFSA
jgi:hypothetical protein